MGRVLKAAAVFGIWLYFKDSIDTWGPNMRFLLYLFGIGLPVYLLLEPVVSSVGNFLKVQWKATGDQQISRERIEEMLRAAHINSQQYAEAPPPPPARFPTLLTSSQIEALNDLRQEISQDEVLQFPVIRVSGGELPNVVPGAGIFTAKIKRNGELENLVVMLATTTAIREFECLCNAYGSLPKDFWAEGHLLPSRAGLCYSVFFVTSFRFCGRRLNF